MKIYCVMATMVRKQKLAHNLYTVVYELTCSTDERVREIKYERRKSERNKLVVEK